jgi:hypothetical protein
VESCVCIKNFINSYVNFNKGEKYLFYKYLFHSSELIGHDTHYVYFNKSKGHSFDRKDHYLFPCFSEHFEIITDMRKRKLNKLD